jgi:hypothetical protein
VALTVSETATALLQCAFDGVDNAGDLEINRVCLVPGEIAWDNCQCGQLALSEVRRYPSNNFPLEEVDHTAECGAGYIVVNFLIALTRCVPSSGEDGEPPPCDDLSLAALQLFRDMGMLRSAVECCLSSLYDTNQLIAFELGAQEVVGPQGGCVGSTLAVQIGIANGCGCG